MNSISVIGRLFADPEMRFSQGENQIAICKYTLAVDAKRRNKTNAIPVTVFGKGAEFADKYFHKGMKVAVTGELDTDTWTDKDGNKRKSFCIIASNQEFCESKRAADEPVVSDQELDDFIKLPVGTEEELPFV